MKESNKNIPLEFLRRERYILVFSFFLSLYLLLQLFKFPDFRITDFSNFWFGEATEKNISISSRIGYFYQGIFVFAGLFGIFFSFLSLLLNRFNPEKDHLRFAFGLAGLGSILAIGNVFGAKSENVTGLFLILFITNLVFNLFRQKFRSIRVLSQPIVQILLIFNTLLAYSGFVYILNINEEKVSGSYGWLLLFFVVISLLFLFFQRSNGIRKSLLFFLPLVWIPLFSFLSSEITIALKYSGNPLIDYQIIFIACLILSFIIFFWRFKRKVKKMSIKSMISKYYAFGIISLLSIFAIYHPIVVYPLELFESANIANAQMRIFEFGELPVFDFMSSHMLYEQWTGWVYHLIHGYSNDFSFMAYFFLNEFIFLLILYFILKEIFNESLLALIAICCLPFLGDLFNSGLLIGILPVFFIKKLMEDPSIKNYLRFYGVLLFLFFWKIDVGVASTFASSFLLLILWMTGKVEFKIKQVLVSFLIVLVFLGLALGFSFLIRRPEYILGNLEAALHYIKASQAHGYSRIAHGFNQGFYFHYFLIPLFAVLLVLLSIIEFKKSRRGDRLSMTHLFGIFFILFFLGNFQRGLVRHSFMDGLDFYWSSYFFVGLVFYLIYWFGKEQKSRIIWIFFIGNVFLFLSFKEFNVSERTMMLERVVSIPSHLGFKAHLVESQYSNRVEIPEEVEKEYKHIVEYLKKELVSEETFYDFSNTPLLYFLTSKKQPSYFCQNLQNTVDDFLQLKQIGQLKNEKVPLLIYSNEPANFWDRTDDVDNSLRYYLLAEYFFQNYQPDTIVDNKWVWKENQNMRFRNKIDFKAIRHLNYGKSAAIWSEFLNGREDLLGEEYLMVPKIDDQGIHYILEMDPQLQRQTKAAFLSFEFDLSSEIYPEENIEWEVRLMHENTIIGSAQFKMFEKRERYIIRLSNFYNWYHVTVDSIELITKPEHLGRMQLKSVKIIKDKRFEG